MNTPFELFRNKEKLRKERMHISLSPAKHSFSLESPPRREKTQQSSRNCLQTRRVQSVRSESIKNKQNLQECIDEEKYQIIVKNTLRKVSNYRLNVSKKGQRIEQLLPSNKMELDKSRKLIVEGANCGKDLIKLNRRKLQQMIMKINGHSTQAAGNYAVPEFIIEKCKINKLKAQLECIEEEIKAEPKRKSSTHRDSYLQYTREGNVWADKFRLNPGEQKQQKFDPKQYLVCSQVPICQQQKESKNKTQCEIMLSNTTIVGFIRQTKKRKYTQSSKIQKQQLEDGYITANLYSSRSKRQREAMKQGNKAEVRKSLSPFKMNRSDGFKQKKQKKLNGFHVTNLKGWDSPEQENDSLLLMHPIFPS